MAYCNFCGSKLTDSQCVSCYKALAEPPPTPPPKTEWTVPEAADALGYSRSNIQWLIQTGQLKAYKSQQSHRGSRPWIIESLERQPRRQKFIGTIKILKALKPANVTEAAAVEVVLKMLEGRDIRKRWGVVDRMVKEYIAAGHPVFSIQDVIMLDPTKQHAVAVYCSRIAAIGRIKRRSRGVYEVVDYEWAKRIRV